jgi:hypothetical protein
VGGTAAASAVVLREADTESTIGVIITKEMTMHTAPSKYLFRPAQNRVEAPGPASGRSMSRASVGMGGAET